MGEEFQRIAVLPVGVGQREEIAALGGAGVVDEDVERRRTRAARIDQLAPARRARADRARTTALRPLPRIAPAHLVERGRVAAGEHEVAALVREGERNAAADAAARSRSPARLPPQAQLHPHFSSRAPPSDVRMRVIASAGEGMKRAFLPRMRAAGGKEAQRSARVRRRVINSSPQALATIRTAGSTTRGGTVTGGVRFALQGLET